jgi:hypothetical protein
MLLRVSQFLPRFLTCQRFCRKKPCIYFNYTSRHYINTGLGQLQIAQYFISDPLFLARISPSQRFNFNYSAVSGTPAIYFRITPGLFSPLFHRRIAAVTVSTFAA